MDGFEHDRERAEGKLPATWRRGSNLMLNLLLLLMIAAFCAAAYAGFGYWKNERDLREAAQREAGNAVLRAENLEKRETELRHKIAELEAEKGTLASEVQEKDAELSKLKETYESLEEKMKQEISQGDIRLTQAEGKIQVDLVDKILFDSGQSEVTVQGAEVLARLGAVLAKLDDKQIQVSGHTDDAPIKRDLQAKFATNWELSASRAVNVVRYLSEKAHVPAKRLIAAGHGQYQPIGSNATPAGRAKNRRIEILLTPVLEKKPASHLVAEAKPEASPPAPAKKPAPER